MTVYEKFIVDLIVELGALYHRTDYDPRKEAKRMTVEWGKKLEEFMRAKPENILPAEREILKHFKLPLSYEPMGQSISDHNGNLVAQVRGWGRLQYKERGDDIQDRFGEMLTNAFNSKYIPSAENDSSQA